MKKILNLNTKTKFLILAGVAIVLLAITMVINLIVVKTNSKNQYEKYGQKSYDDVLTLSVSMYENRDSSLTDTNKSNNFETSRYNFVVLVTKPEKTGYKTAIKYMRCHLIIETKNGKFIYKDDKKGTISSSSTSKAMTESSRSTYYTFSSALSKTIKNASTSVETKDETPKNIYVKLYYRAEIRNTQSNTTEYSEKSIEYQTDVASNKSFSAPKTTREVDLTSESTRGNIKNSGSEVFDINVLFEKGVTSSTERKYYEDKFAIKVLTNKINLGTKKVKNAKIELIGKIENDPNDFDDQFSNVIYLACYYGNLPTVTDLRQIDNALDTVYKISEISVRVKITFADNSTQTANFKLNVEKLATK